MGLVKTPSGCLTPERADCGQDAIESELSYTPSADTTARSSTAFSTRAHAEKLQVPHASLCPGSGAWRLLFPMEGHGQGPCNTSDEVTPPELATPFRTDLGAVPPDGRDSMSIVLPAQHVVGSMCTWLAPHLCHGSNTLLLWLRRVHVFEQDLRAA